MGTHVVKVPDVGEGIAEVELVSWSVEVGQEVGRNEILAEVMTDKANVEIPSPVAGVISNLNGEVGATMAVGSSLIELTVEGEGTPVTPERPTVAAESTGSPAAPTNGSRVESGPSPTPAETSTEERPFEVIPAATVVAPTAAAHGDQTVVPTSVVRTSAPVGPGAARPEGERPRATPAVRHRAREAGVDLRRVRGSGPAGRITHEDLDRYFERDRTDQQRGSAVRQRRADTTVEEHPIVGIRRKIAERMVASTTSIPHITYVEEVDVTALEDLRRTLNEQRNEEQPRLTLLPFLVRALVRHLPEFPSINAHVDDDRGMLITFGGIHVGIATQTPNGLVVPVVRHAETLSIWAIADNVNALAEAARTGRIAPTDLRGSTITITSLGALGGLVTTPVINKPEVAIVGVNKIATRPVWIDNAFVPRQIMNLSSSFDHRIVDGWDAASFVQRLRGSLEQPALLFLDES